MVKRASLGVKPKERNPGSQSCVEQSSGEGKGGSQKTAPATERGRAGTLSLLTKRHSGGGGPPSLRGRTNGQQGGRRSRREKLIEDTRIRTRVSVTTKGKR